LCDYAAASRGKQAASSHSPLAISQPNHQEPRTEKQSSTQLPEWSPLSVNTRKQWTSAIVRLCSSKQGQQQHGQSCSDRSKQRHKQERSATEPVDQQQHGQSCSDRSKQQHKQERSATEPIDQCRSKQRQAGTISDRAHRPAATRPILPRILQRQSTSSSDRAQRAAARMAKRAVPMHINIART
jgi:hypothetical protein